MAPERSPENVAKTNHAPRNLMNKQMTYEITIKKKLENIPVPDLSEMIWARIENELDADEGNGDDHNPPAPSSPAGGIMLGGTALLFLIALLFYFINNEQKEIPQIEKVQTTLPVENNQSKLPAANGNVQPVINPPKQMQESVTNMQPPANVPATSQTIINDSMPEPVVVRGNTIPLTLPNTMDSLPPKKTRGVTGITNDDYKIVPKKDSSRGD